MWPGFYSGPVPYVVEFLPCSDSFSGGFPGLKKEPFSCLGQVDFVAKQVTFHSHLPNLQIPICIDWDRGLE